MRSDGLGNTYTVSLFVEHEGSDGSPDVGAITSLTLDMDSGVAPAVLILGAGDSTRRRRH